MEVCESCNPSKRTKPLSGVGEGAAGENTMNDLMTLLMSNASVRESFECLLRLKRIFKESRSTDSNLEET
jgi:hypothetical protein